VNGRERHCGITVRSATISCQYSHHLRPSSWRQDDAQNSTLHRQHQHPLKLPSQFRLILLLSLILLVVCGMTAASIRASPYMAVVWIAIGSRFPSAHRCVTPVCNCWWRTCAVSCSDSHDRNHSQPLQKAEERSPISNSSRSSFSNAFSYAITKPTPIDRTVVPERGWSRTYSEPYKLIPTSHTTLPLPHFHSPHPM